MSTLYCSISDVQNRLSANGVSYRIDDNPPTADGDVLDDASRQIDEYAYLGYGSDQLVGSDWIKHKCADIAAYLLCERRGNPVPPGIAQKYDVAIRKLERVAKGVLQIPDASAIAPAIPVMSNVGIFLTRTGPRSVVQPSRSSTMTQPSGYVQSSDPLDILDYTI